MRIWSLHPSYLDSKGLVALWREALLAKKVLEGKTKGYKNHPQLQRFKATKNPVSYINQFLKAVYREAKRRNYHFDKGKIDWSARSGKITVTSGQLKFEIGHLLKKLRMRDNYQYRVVKAQKGYISHPLFKTTKGEVESWEVIER